MEDELMKIGGTITISNAVALAKSVGIQVYHGSDDALAKLEAAAKKQGVSTERQRWDGLAVVVATYLK